MKPRHHVLVVVLVVALAGCGSSKPAATDQPQVPVSQAVTVPAPTATQTPEVTVEVGGKWYPQKYYNCATKLWNDRTAEWNKLVEKRDATGAAEVVVNGVAYPTAADYGKAKGWPASIEATMTAPETKKVCG